MTINLMMLEAAAVQNRAKYIEANAQLQTLLRHPSPSEVEDYTEKVLQYAREIAVCEHAHQVLQEVAAAAPEEVAPPPDASPPTETVDAPTPMPSEAPSDEQQEESFTEEELLKRSPTMRKSLQRKFQDGE